MINRQTKFHEEKGYFVFATDVCNAVGYCSVSSSFEKFRYP